MCLGPHFEGFWAWWTLVGLETARSNLGQPWSTLVKLGQTSPNSGKCILGRISRVFGHSGPQSGQKRLGQTPVNTRSTLVKLGQSLPNFGKCVPDHVLGLFGMISFRRIRPTWLGLPRFTCRDPRKSRGKKWGYDNYYLGFEASRTFKLVSGVRIQGIKIRMIQH